MVDWLFYSNTQGICLSYTPPLLIEINSYSFSLPGERCQETVDYDRNIIVWEIRYYSSSENYFFSPPNLAKY